LQSEKSFVELLSQLRNLKETLSEELLELLTNLGVLRFPVTLAQEHDLHERSANSWVRSPSCISPLVTV
jgi:hypothetical protein